MLLSPGTVISAPYWAEHGAIAVAHVSNVVIGVASYMKLGRNEDPTFTIKAMTVRTQWPGATVNDTLLQITERTELDDQYPSHGGHVNLRQGHENLLSLV